MAQRGHQWELSLVYKEHVGGLIATVPEDFYLLQETTVHAAPLLESLGTDF
jgi:hypothetical protein